MLETEFWPLLARRVSRALASLQGNNLRFLWCDDLIPDRPVRTAINPEYITGDAFISEDSGKSFRRYRFRLPLASPNFEGENVVWETLLPSESSVDWLHVDRAQRRLEFLMPDTESAG